MLALVKPSATTTNSARVDNSRDTIPHIGNHHHIGDQIYGLRTQTISSALPESPPWIWVNEPVTICTSMMAKVGCGA